MIHTFIVCSERGKRYGVFLTLDTAKDIEDQKASYRPHRPFKEHEGKTIHQYFEKVKEDHHEHSS